MPREDLSPVSGFCRCARSSSLSAWGATVRGYVRYARGALGSGRPAPPVRTQRGRLVRVARTYPTEAPGRTCQLRLTPVTSTTYELEFIAVED